MSKVLKTIVRQVRTQKNQQVINIPGDVRKTLNLNGGDSIAFIILDTGGVALVRVDPTELTKHIGWKVD